MNGARLWLRIAGVGTLVGALVLYDPGAAGALQQLGLPLAMAFAAWALTRNLTAVALGGTLLAAIHANPSSADPYAAVAYPVLAAAGAGVLAVTLWLRFRARIAATHDARWAARRGTPASATPAASAAPGRGDHGKS